jgi:hypothetical protein
MLNKKFLGNVDVCCEMVVGVEYVDGATEMDGLFRMGLIVRILALLTAKIRIYNIRCTLRKKNPGIVIRGYITVLRKYTGAAVSPVFS